MKTDPAQWPESDILGVNGPPRPWLHSDIREKAFAHNWNAYKRFTEIGSLNKNN